MGPNWTSSLELAIRLINWSLTWQLLGGLESPLFREAEHLDFRARWLESIYRHAHFIKGHLSRYSSANNHLIGEAAGLFVGGVTWPYWEEIRKWGNAAKAILEEEALKQNGQDGVHWEQAVSYQQFVLDFLIISGLAGRANGMEFSAAFWRRIEAMLEYLASIMDCRGNVPMIGDADDGYVVRLSREEGFCPYRSLLATGAVLFGRAEFKAKAGRLDGKTRWLLGEGAEEEFSRIPELAAPPQPVRRAFPDGGYYILGKDFGTEEEVLCIVDCGPLGYLSIAAHGHADALAIYLSVAGREFLVDPGTYAYHTKKEWRDYFRGTSAHNTVRIDGENQSVIGGNFMWTRKAECRCDAFELGEDEDLFSGRHDGYERLRDPVVHRREIRYLKREGEIIVTDTLECKGSHTVERFWHFAEDCRVALRNHTVLAENHGVKVVLESPGTEGEVRVYRGDDRIPLGWVSRRFDVKVPTATALWRTRIGGRCRLTTIITVRQ